MFTSKSILIAIACSSVAIAGAASAHPRLSDAQYLAGARCQALMSSASLGKVDTTAIDAVLKVQAASRMPAINDKAAEVREDTSRSAAHAGPTARGALIAERDGSCAEMTHQAMVSAVAGSVSAGR